ncbi:MAG: ABC-ATPase domain-containing protein [Candidatus Tectomicrobia bacterium]|uniref:ABC-ATPase domain-containing protein n=1 Tax=Tectimicrobiota bacterium TaxID=2528274 RepID=A0A932GNN5_UNCTE|nr:ABC-ATPase domain-containing protein [Candidatus Tectomicrobia bacterium]
MRDWQDLRALLNCIDRRGYKAYKDLEGTYQGEDFALSIDHVQGDPFASPSRLRVSVSQAKAGFPPALFSTRIRRLALCDYLVRVFAEQIRRHVRGRRGTGHSGQTFIDRCGQEVLNRNAVILDDARVEARFGIGLPAAGRTILAQEAQVMFFQEIPALASGSLFFANLDAEAVRRHVETVEDQDALRSSLKGKKLVTFLANSSILPRASGVDDRPLHTAEAVPLQAPPSLEVELQCPNRGAIRGLGIPEGVTLIVGGGFHGKSTLLRAIERGVYNHIPGDGREYVVSRPDALKVRAEEGRSVCQVDIRPFIGPLPQGKDTRCFSTENASGSTSQAAGIMEGIEAGAEVLLMDEDTSATNFMIRDHRMQQLVAKEKEPITPFLDKVRLLYQDHGISTVLVMGGSGDYFEVVDTVIMMDEFVPRDVTSRAREIARTGALPRRREGGDSFGTAPNRHPDPASLSPGKGRRETVVEAKGTRTLQFGRESVDLNALEQLVSPGQTRAIGRIIVYAARHHWNRGRSLREALELTQREIEEKGLDVISPFPAGDLAEPRLLEVAAAINRMRGVRMF